MSFLIILTASLSSSSCSTIIVCTAAKIVKAENSSNLSCIITLYRYRRYFVHCRYQNDTGGKGQRRIRTRHRNLTILYGRGVRFDVLAEDSEGKLYDCEVQRANEGATPRRARYNSSMMDSRELAKGAEFSALPETWVIFITENDIYGAGCPLYHVERVIQELQRSFDDEAHILYVNGANHDDTPLGRLMQDFFCERPEQMNYKELAQRVDYFKAEAEGVNAMCELMEKFGEKKLQEGREEGRVEGHREGMLDMARSLLMLNVPVEVIEKSSGLTRAEILAL